MTDTINIQSEIAQALGWTLKNDTHYWRLMRPAGDVAMVSVEKADDHWVNMSEGIIFAELVQGYVSQYDGDMNAAMKLAKMLPNFSLEIVTAKPNYPLLKDGDWVARGVIAEAHGKSNLFIGIHPDPAYAICTAFIHWHDAGRPQ